VTQTYRFKFEKLIRDKLLEDIKSKGIKATQLIIDQNEYIKYLKEKLVEEASEVLEAKNDAELLEELADVLEIMITLSHACHVPFELIESARLKKKEAKGGFEGKTYVKFVEVEENNIAIANYLARPHKYPQIK
jgi:predicted house-cleaning noncanonical NTP pyrophosphatase (MazG superfamily)